MDESCQTDELAGQAWVEAVYCVQSTLVLIV